MSRRRAHPLVAIVVAVATGVGLLPGVASAHDFENPGFNGARLFVESQGEYKGTHYVGAISQPLVKGTDFAPNQHVEIYQCPSSAPIDPRNDCVPAGTALTDGTGFFQTDVSVAAWMPTKGTYCAIYGTSQCYMVAATYALDRPTEVTSEAEHDLCFVGGFDGAPFNVLQNYPDPKPRADCAGPPEPTETTTPTTLPPPSQWQPAASMNVARQRLATAVGADGRIYALGGADGAGNALGSVEVLDPCGAKSWSVIAPMPTPRKDLAASTGPDGRIYAIGGRQSDGTPLATVEAYDPATNTWSTALAGLAVPRANLGAATGPDGLIYAVGGQTGAEQVANPTYLVGGYGSAMVEAYDTAANFWQQVTPMSWPQIDPEVVTGPNGRIYALSADDASEGAGWDERTGVFGNAMSYSPAADGGPGTWRTENSPYLGSSSDWLGAATTGPDGLIHTVGGHDVAEGSRRFVRDYNTVTKAWTLQVEGLTTRRWLNAAATGRDGRIYAVGGLDVYEEPEDQWHEDVLASTEAQQVAPSSCPPGRPPADFDGDADTDVSVFRPSNGIWYVKDGASIAWGTEGDIPVPGDYDGDAKVDQAIFRPSTGLWAIHGSGGVDTFVTYGIGTDIPVPADYDGDGRTDIAIFRPAYGTWWMRHSATGIDVPITFGISGDVPVPGDYDGDARADLGIFRGGSWFTLPSSGGAYTSQSYGNPGDIPVPGDYDADHRADVAVFRPSDGTWSLHRSSDGADEVFGFGISGDVPVPGDYNADGIADPAVYRNGQWFIETGETHSWGIATDIALPLPAAVRLAYFPEPLD